MSEQDRRRLHAIVKGHVQGVSFRYYTLMRANELQLVGWVCNLHDRSVEVVAEGEPSQLDALLQFLHQGPPAARVQSVEAEWSTALDTFSMFSIQ